jgi:hypothetical protein
MPTEFTRGVVVGGAVENIRVRATAVGDLNGGDLEVVGGLAGGVSAEEQAVGRV